MHFGGQPLRSVPYVSLCLDFGCRVSVCQRWSSVSVAGSCRTTGVKHEKIWKFAVGGLVLFISGSVLALSGESESHSRPRFSQNVELNWSQHIINWFE